MDTLLYILRVKNKKQSHFLYCRSHLLKHKKEVQYDNLPAGVWKISATLHSYSPYKEQIYSGQDCSILPCSGAEFHNKHDVSKPGKDFVIRCQANRYLLLTWAHCSHGRAVCWRASIRIFPPTHLTM